MVPLQAFVSVHRSFHSITKQHRVEAVEVHIPTHIVTFLGLLTIFLQFSHPTKTAWLPTYFQFTSMPNLCSHHIAYLYAALQRNNLKNKSQGGSQDGHQGMVFTSGQATVPILFLYISSVYWCKTPELVSCLKKISLTNSWQTVLHNAWKGGYSTLHSFQPQCK